MQNFKIIVFFLSLISISVSYAQNNNDIEAELNSNNALNTAFNKFYKYKIRKEKKDKRGEPFYCKIDQLKGLHYLDYDEDGFKDVLIEFSATSSDGDSSNLFVAVLFQNSDNNYVYRAHFNPNSSFFKEYKEPYFIFNGEFKSFTEGVTIERIKLVGNKFVKY